MKYSLKWKVAGEVPSTMTSERKDWIDFAKFIGLLFVLLSHAEVTIPLLSGLGNLFYIAIFFVLAGYTYHDQDMSCIAFAKKSTSYSASLFCLQFHLVFDYDDEKPYNGKLSVR